MIRLQDFVVNRLPEDERELAAARMGERMDDYAQMDTQTPTPPGDEAEAVHNATEEANEPPHQSGRALSSPIPQSTKRSSVPTKAGMSARPVDDGLVPSESEVENARWRDGLGVWGNMIAGAIRGAAGMRTDAPETPHEAQDLAVERRRGLLERARQAREQEESGRNFSYRAKRDAIGDQNEERRFQSSEARRQAEDERRARIEQRLSDREASLEEYRNAQLGLSSERNALAERRLLRGRRSGTTSAGATSSGAPPEDELISNMQDRIRVIARAESGEDSGPQFDRALQTLQTDFNAALRRPGVAGGLPGANLWLQAQEERRNIRTPGMSDQLRGVTVMAPSNRAEAENATFTVRERSIASMPQQRLDFAVAMMSSPDSIRTARLFRATEEERNAASEVQGAFNDALLYASGKAVTPGERQNKMREFGLEFPISSSGAFLHALQRLHEIGNERVRSLRESIPGNIRDLGTGRRSSGQDGQRVRVRRPDGREGMIPAANVERARAQGWTILE